MQRVLAVLVSLVTLPFMAGLAAAIRIDSPGPAIYRAIRVGRGGVPFTCFKLRTMRWTPADAGGALSIASDSRVTRVGRLLRATRLDEVPQFWNVARGEMRIIGPRPEDPRFVDFTQPAHARVFRSTPGITGPAQLVFANEALLLRGEDPERDYVTRILPAKLRVDEAYLERRGNALDAWVLAQTVATAFGRAPDPEQVRRRLGMSEEEFPRLENERAATGSS